MHDRIKQVPNATKLGSVCIGALIGRGSCILGCRCAPVSRGGIFVYVDAVLFLPLAGIFLVVYVGRLFGSAPRVLRGWLFLLCGGLSVHDALSIVRI